MHDPDNGTEAIAFTAPILDAAGTFRGVVTSRVAMSTLEDVTTRTVRSLESRQEFAGGVAFQMVTSEGMVFVDSDLLHKAPLDRPQSDLLASKTPPFGDAGVVEEEYRGRPVVTGFARTKGFGDFPGLGWHVLVRMDRDRILDPITSILWKVGITGAVVWVPMVVLLFWSTSHLRAEYQTGPTGKLVGARGRGGAASEPGAQPGDRGNRAGCAGHHRRQRASSRIGTGRHPPYSDGRARRRWDSV